MTPSPPSPRPSGARLPHADLSAPTRMAEDCRAAGRNLAPGLERAARLAVQPAPSLRWEDHPRDAPKPSIEVHEAAIRLAAALHLHLD